MASNDIDLMLAESVGKLEGDFACFASRNSIETSTYA